MAFGVSKRKLNLRTTSTNAISPLLYNSLVSSADGDKGLSTAAIGSTSVVFMRAIYRKFKMSVSKLADVILIYLC